MHVSQMKEFNSKFFSAFTMFAAAFIVPQSYNIRSNRHVLKLQASCSKWLCDNCAFSIATSHLWSELPFKIKATPSVQ